MLLVIQRVRQGLLGEFQLGEFVEKLIRYWAGISVMETFEQIIDGDIIRFPVKGHQHGDWHGWCDFCQGWV
jgi:hypothetical protein